MPDVCRDLQKTFFDVAYGIGCVLASNKIDQPRWIFIRFHGALESNTRDLTFATRDLKAALSRSTKKVSAGIGSSAETRNFILPGG